MKIAIYSKARDMFMVMMAMTLKRLKHDVVVHHRDNWSLVDCDLVIVHGKRDDIINAYKDKPVFVTESGYLKRVNSIAQKQVGHWQLSYGKLNGLPGFDCPPDRFDSLGLDIKRPRNKKGYVLVLGQVPTDSALNGTDHKKWLTEQIEHYENQGFTVRYRKHPRGGLELADYPSVEGSLIDAIEGAAFCVAYNSTAGFEVLLNGVGIVCDECAPYAELSGEKCPSITDRRKFFNRMAYGQWRVDQTPDAVQFMLNEWLPKCH